MSLVGLPIDLFNLILLEFNSRERHVLKHTSKIILGKVLEFTESDVYWNRKLYKKYCINPVFSAKSLYIMVNSTRHNCECRYDDSGWLLRDCIKYKAYDYFDALLEANLITCKDICSELNDCGRINKRFTKPIGSYMLSRVWSEIEDDKDRYIPDIIALNCQVLTEHERKRILNSLGDKLLGLKFTDKLFNHFTLDEILSVAFDKSNYYLLKDLFVYDKTLVEKHRKLILLNIDKLYYNKEDDVLIKETVRKFSDCLLKYRAEFHIAIQDKDPDIKRFDSPKLIKACKRHGPLDSCASRTILMFSCMTNVCIVFSGNLYYDMFYFYYTNNPIVNLSAVRQSIQNIKDDNAKNVARTSLKEATYDMNKGVYNAWPKKWDPNESVWE